MRVPRRAVAAALPAGLSRAARRLGLLLLVATAAGPVAAEAKAAASCGGRDMRAVVAETEPSVDAQIRARTAAMPFARGILFRLTKPGVAPSHVLGTIHILEPGAAALSPPAEKALAQAKVLALELKEIGSFADPEAVTAMLPKLLPLVVAKRHEALADLVPADALSPIEAALKARGLPAAFARTFKPSFVTSILAIPPCAQALGAKPQGVDLKLASLAQGRGLPVIGLETLDEQFKVMLGQPPEVERALAAGLPQNLASLDDMFATLQQAYREGDIGWVVAVSELRATWATGPAAMPASYHQAMLVRRNQLMHDRARSLVEKGGALIAVGAAHLPGEEGLLRLFEKDGYTVERID